MRVLPLVIGGGAFAYWWTHRARVADAATVTALPGRWTWPVAMWNGRRPVISDGFGSPRPGGIRHGGVDVMFARKPDDAFRAGSPNGSRGFVMPDGVAALAAADGIVWSAMPTSRGFAVVIDHAPHPYATFYTHLEKLLVAPTARGESKQHVQRGQPIGIVGFDPLDPARLKHLHFELWNGGPSKAVDPALAMRDWDVASGEPRNAGLVYRPVGASGEPYPQWVRDLKGESGVYVIREIDGEIVYVGSSQNRLYATVTRHFQRWRRFKGFWRGQYGEGHDPGLTYRRERCEVAIRRTRPDDALAEEARLIVRLRPRDNLLGQHELEDAPF